MSTEEVRIAVGSIVLVLLLAVFALHFGGAFLAWVAPMVLP